MGEVAADPPGYLVALVVFSMLAFLVTGWAAPDTRMRALGQYVLVCTLPLWVACAIALCAVSNF